MERPEPSLFDGMPGSIIVSGFTHGYERKGIFSIAEVFSALAFQYADFRGDRIDMTSQRYQVFHRSLVCVSCGLTGQYFAKERSTRSDKTPLAVRAADKWHFNLYAICLYPWKEMLITKDHIIPKSKGGPDLMSNYQTMCMGCNCRKADLLLPDGGRRLVVRTPDCGSGNEDSTSSAHPKLLCTH